jgi:chromosome segregation ATPase
MHNPTDRNATNNNQTEPRRNVEPVSDVTLEARSESKEAEIAGLNESLSQVNDQAEALAVRRHELAQQIAAAVDKAHELHTRLVAAKNDLGGES